MQAPATAPDFIRLIRQSGLIDEAALARLALDLPAEPAACAESLVGRGLLTRFQAEQLVAGRVRGLVMGRYRILRLLGKGGMGLVYLAEHPALGRKVALKVLGEEQSREKLALERFFREARSAAALDHPNIVRLHDIAHEGGSHYLVMEFVDGTDLQALVDQTGPLHWAQAAGYVAQAAAGLQHAHERGFIHRDIKPANLIVARDGTVKVLDMGLARSVADPKDALTGLIHEDVIAGTADYLSPEQALNVQLDTRTDIYSLGATLFALLTGRPPYEGTTVQKLAQHQTAAAPDVRQIRADVPPGLAEVVARMMAKRPSERYQTASEAAEALAPWVSPTAGVGPTVSLRSGATTRLLLPRAPANRLRLPRLLGASRGLVAAACVASLLVGGLLFAFLARPNPAIPQGHGEQPEPSAPPAPANPVLVLTGHVSAVNDVVLSPDGTRLASIDWSGRLVIWDASTGRRLHVPPTRPGARGLVCATTRDGRLLVAGERMPILAFNWETGKEAGEYPGHEGHTWGLAVSPDGRHLLSCGSDGAAVLRELATGKDLRRFEFAAGTVWAVAFSPDGTKLAAATGVGSSPEESHLIRVWSAADGELLHQLTGHTLDVRSIAFRPDGATLASGGFDGTVRLWDLATGVEISSISAHEGVVERVFFLPGGKQLLTCGGPLWDAPQGGAGSAVKLWDTDAGRELRRWGGEDWSELICLAPSRDGRFAAAGSRNCVVRVWPLTDAPAVRLVHAFELSHGTGFRSRYQDRRHSDLRAETLVGNGVYMHCWKNESVAEFRGEVTDGKAWVGVTNLNDAATAQVVFQFDDAVKVPLAPGKTYRLRLEYRTTNDADGRAYVRNPKGGDFPSIAEAALGGTDGKWKAVEVTFRRPQGGKLDVCVVNNAVGEGNLLAVRSVEVFEVEAGK